MDSLDDFDVTPRPLRVVKQQLDPDKRTPYIPRRKSSCAQDARSNASSRATSDSNDSVVIRLPRPSDDSGHGEQQTVASGENRPTRRFPIDGYDRTSTEQGGAIGRRSYKLATRLKSRLAHVRRASSSFRSSRSSSQSHQFARTAGLRHRTPSIIDDCMIPPNPLRSPPPETHRGHSISDQSSLEFSESNTSTGKERIGIFPAPICSYNLSASVISFQTYQTTFTEITTVWIAVNVDCQSNDNADCSAETAQAVDVEALTDVELLFHLPPSYALLTTVGKLVIPQLCCRESVTTLLHLEGRMASERRRRLPATPSVQTCQIPSSHALMDQLDAMLSPMKEDTGSASKYLGLDIRCHHNLFPSHIQLSSTVNLLLAKHASIGTDGPSKRVSLSSHREIVRSSLNQLEGEAAKLANNPYRLDLDDLTRCQHIIELMDTILNDASRLPAHLSVHAHQLRADFLDLARDSPVRAPTLANHQSPSRRRHGLDLTRSRDHVGTYNNENDSDLKEITNRTGKKFTDTYRGLIKKVEQWQTPKVTNDPVAGCRSRAELYLAEQQRPISSMGMPHRLMKYASMNQLNRRAVLPPPSLPQRLTRPSERSMINASRRNHCVPNLPARPATRQSDITSEARMIWDKMRVTSEGSLLVYSSEEERELAAESGKQVCGAPWL